VEEVAMLSPQQLNDILTQSQSHGIVHASTGSFSKTQTSTDSLRGRPPITPHPAFLANLKQLCIPSRVDSGEYPQAMASPGSIKASPGGIQASPGPAGPGIKERMKWHLARQAGP
jgi:hypothetical protein